MLSLFIPSFVIVQIIYIYYNFTVIYVDTTYMYLIFRNKHFLHGAYYFIISYWLIQVLAYDRVIEETEQSRTVLRPCCNRVKISLKSRIQPSSSIFFFFFIVVAVVCCSVGIAIVHL